MAFKLDIGQFFAGGADVIVQKVKAEEAQAREDESWDRKQKITQDAIDKRTRGDIRRADTKKAELLGEQLTVLFGEQASTEMMKKGYGFGSSYAEIGQKYFDAGRDPKSFLNAELFPTLNADGSNKQQVDDAAQRFLAGTNGTASLINRDAMFKGLEEPVEMKVLTNFQDQYAFYSSQAFLMQDITNKQHYNPTEAVKFQNAANFALGKIEEAAKKDPNIKNPYAKVSITTYTTNARRKAREDEGFKMGLEDRIEEKLYGDESKILVAELKTAAAIANFNTRKDGTIVDEQFDNEQNFIRDTANAELRALASKTFNIGKAGTDPDAPVSTDGVVNRALLNNFKVTKNETTGMYNVLDTAQFTTLSKQRSLSVGDVVIANDPKTGPRIMIYTGVGKSGFLMGGQLTSEELKYN